MKENERTPSLPRDSAAFEAFDSQVDAWSELVASPRGRLRHEATLHHLRAHLGNPPLSILDVGCGTGELAAELARDGHSVTLLDFSEAMLAEAARRCAGLGVDTVQGDVRDIQRLVHPGSYDAVLCHSLLEFVPDPEETLLRLGAALRPGGLISIEVGNRHHAPLRKLFLEGDVGAALNGLDSEVPATDLWGLPRRTFNPDDILTLLDSHGLKLLGEYGIRVFSDLLAAPTDWDALPSLELAAGRLLPYRRMARFMLFIAAKR